MNLVHVVAILQILNFPIPPLFRAAPLRRTKFPSKIWCAETRVFAYRVVSLGLFCWNYTTTWDRRTDRRTVKT